MRKLIRCEIWYSEPDNWTLKFGTRSATFVGSPEGFAKQLRLMGATDDREAPKSYRSVSYPEIVRGIQRGEDRIVWVREEPLRDLETKSFETPNNPVPWG